MVIQDTIALDGSTKIQCTTTSLTINNIIINNPTNVPYTITVNRYLACKDTTTQLYYFELDAEDVLKDNTPYPLKLGDYLQLITDVAGTTFYAEVE